MQLSLLETVLPEPSSAAWLALDDEHRVQALAILARLIAQLAARRQGTVAADPEEQHE